MPGSSFAIGDAVRTGWSIATKNIGTFIAAVIIMLVVMMAPALPGLNQSAVVGAVFWVFSMVLGLGFMRIALRFVDGDKGELADLFSAINLALSYVIAAIIVGVAVMVATLFLVVPGIYLGLRLQFFSWAMVDQELGAMDAIRHSWSITEGAAGKLFLLMLVLAGINVLGMLALGIGMLLTAPTALVAMGYTYRQLNRAG